jgi:hypothetical protein
MPDDIKYCPVCAHFTKGQEKCHYCKRAFGLSPVSGIEALVCEDIAKRQAFGIAKYGKTVADNPLSLEQWLQHAYEECLDQAVYLKRAMAELKKGQRNGT